ncbi:hypothetical protein H6P81_002999 [Aristolochia fimbriata]|uniref:Uncharacterized protein n=1 Tax=Aristolochia fimbriata TaxID=158543 RepID=A0AAV7FF73_ARIFI|nr:hypothetical protein H6P81_002999 [Aristolochia fimbriata]
MSHKGDAPSLDAAHRRRRSQPRRQRCAQRPHIRDDEDVLGGKLKAKTESHHPVTRGENQQESGQNHKSK